MLCSKSFARADGILRSARGKLLIRLPKSNARALLRGNEEFPGAVISAIHSGSLRTPRAGHFALQSSVGFERNRHQQFGPGYARANFKLSTMLANAFAHSGEPHAHMRAVGPEMVQFFSGDSDTVVADLKHGVALRHVKGDVRLRTLR